MAERRSTPINEPRVSSRLSGKSVLSADEIAKTIADVKVAAEEEQARLSRPLPDMVNWRRRPMTAGAFVLLAVAVWGIQLMVWRQPAPVISDRARESGLRFTMGLQAARVEDFRQRTKKLPTSITELSEVFEGMSYVRIDSTHYRLTGTDENLTLTYRSDSSLRAFIGGSVLSIRERRKQ